MHRKIGTLREVPFYLVKLHQDPAHIVRLGDEMGTPYDLSRLESAGIAPGNATKWLGARLEALAKLLGVPKDRVGVCTPESTPPHVVLFK